VVPDLDDTVVIKELGDQYIGEVISHGSRHGRRGPRIIVDGVVIDTVDAIGFGIIGVVVQFIPDHEEDQQARANSQRQAQDIDDGETQAAAHIAQGGDKVVKQHMGL
jgi:hypothetical protein